MSWGWIQYFMIYKFTPIPLTATSQVFCLSSVKLKKCRIGGEEDPVQIKISPEKMTPGNEGMEDVIVRSPINYM